MALKSWLTENGNAVPTYCPTITIMIKNTTILCGSALCCDYHIEIA